MECQELVDACLWALTETNKSGASAGSIFFKIKNIAIWWDAAPPRRCSFQTSSAQQTGQEPAITSWSAFPTGWPNAALRLCFCKTVGRDFSYGPCPRLQKPWQVRGGGSLCEEGDCGPRGWCLEHACTWLSDKEYEKKDINSPYPEFPMWL